MNRIKLALACALVVLGVGAMPIAAVRADDHSSLQMAAYDNVGNIGMYCLFGQNQNDKPAYNCWDTTGWQTDFYGYWWLKNTSVTVSEYNYSGALQATVYEIPTDITNSSYWYCFYASPGYDGWPC